MIENTLGHASNLLDTGAGLHKRRRGNHDESSGRNIYIQPSAMIVGVMAIGFELCNPGRNT